MMFTLHSGAHAVCRLISVECMTHMATMQHVYYYSHQLGFVAHHIHLCFQARMSDESQLAPPPRL